MKEITDTIKMGLNRLIFSANSPSDCIIQLNQTVLTDQTGSLRKNIERLGPALQQ